MRNRTRLVAAAVVVAGLALTGCGSERGSGAAASTEVERSEVTFYGGVGSTSNEEWVQFSQGARIVAESVGSGRYEPKSSEFDGAKHLQTFRALFATPCEACVLAIDTASSAYTKAIVDLVERARVPTVTIWNKPQSLHPWDGYEHWVAHTAFDGVDSGYRNAKALIEAIGGEGNIVALQGIPDNPPAKQRLEGLQKALEEHPQVKLLDTQPADWDSAKAQNVTETWLAKYGDRIDGIFSSSDGMSVGAVAALRARGLNGEIPVTGSDGNSDGLRLVKSGDMVSTMFIDPVYMGAITSAIAYAARVGDIEPSELSHAQRQFYLEQTLVTKENVDEFMDREIDREALSYETLKQDFWANSAGPIED